MTYLKYILTISVIHNFVSQIAGMPALGDRLAAPVIPATYEAVPGNSPFRHMIDPKDDLFAINSLMMAPAKPMIGGGVAFRARGTFGADIESINLKLNIDIFYDNGQKGIVQFDDDFCTWFRVVQGGNDNSCPPKKGPADLFYDTDLPLGWFPEGNYSIEINAMADKQVSHLIGAMELTNIPLSSGDSSGTVSTA